MYLVYDKNYVNKGKLIQKTDLLDLDGFLMASKNKVFHIQNSNIREIKIMNRNLANPFVCHKVFQKYNRLIAYLTELLLDDDDSGDSIREALNQIERFRLEIKNKYREYLKQKELEKMSKQLMVLKKESMKRLMEIQNQSLELQQQNNRSK